MKKRKEQPEKEPVTREDAAHAVNLAYACAHQVLHDASRLRGYLEAAHVSVCLISNPNGTENDAGSRLIGEMSRAQRIVSESGIHAEILYAIYEQLREEQHPASEKKEKHENQKNQESQ